MFAFLFFVLILEFKFPPYFVCFYFTLLKENLLGKLNKNNNSLFF